VISLLGRLVQGIGLAVTALILSLMLLLNLHQARGFLADWIPARHQAETAQLLLNLDRIWVGYIFANVIYGAVVGLGSFVEYRLLGVPYPLVMAVITGVITPIPTIGGLLASLIVAVPCFFLGSSVFVDMPNGTFTLLVYLLNVAITQVSYYLVALPVIGRLSRLPTALVFIGVTAGMVTGNILLAFLSVPILSTIVISGKYVLSKILQLDQVPGQEPVESRQPGFFSQLLLAKQG
jgi:predicted PurR-regulated permease PerM